MGNVGFYSVGKERNVSHMNSSCQCVLLASREVSLI